MKFLICVSLLWTVASGNELHLRNYCPFTVWPRILGNSGKEQPDVGDFALGENEVRVLDVTGDWSGKIWARTNCGGDRYCETGDCRNKIECKRAGGFPPVTLAEITFSKADDLDFYDVSLINGYNLPIITGPIDGQGRGGGYYDCGKAGCVADLNAICPNELAIRNYGGKTVACMSACMKFNTDEYCCRGAHRIPATCKSDDWPVSYPSIFKQACPDVYSYAYDGNGSTFTCRATKYEIVFCP